MLDVHPPEHTPHTWRDFFIHIATIVLGLVIAIGLEQTVEYLHRRHELKETRAALAQERNQNRLAFAYDVANFRLINAILENRMRVFLYLQAHPGAPEDQLPGVLDWDASWDPIKEAVWKNAQQTQTLALLPRQEAEDDAGLYQYLETADASVRQTFATMIRGDDFEILDPNPSHLTPAQVAAQIELTTEAIRENGGWGTWLAIIHIDYPDFQPAFTFADSTALYQHPETPEQKHDLAAASAKTAAALAPFHAAANAAKKADPHHH